MPVEVVSAPPQNVTVTQTTPANVSTIQRPSAVSIATGGVQGATGPAGSDGAPGAVGTFANTFIDVANSGTWNSGTAFTTVPLVTKISDPGNNYDTNTYFYTVPSTGLYLCLGRIRINDASPATQFGMGINIGNNDGPYFQWQFSVAGGGQNRYTQNYQRLANFTAGQQLRLYMYVEGNATFNAGAMNIIRIA